MKNSDHDIPAAPGSQGWSADLSYGQSGEGLARTFLEAVTVGSVEVKTDRWRNGRWVVEMSQNPRKTGWKPSGLAVTKAEWWCYVYTLDGAMSVVSVARLKRCVNNLPKSRLRTFVPNSSNPTRGFLLEPSEVLDLMISPAYDA